jgi:tetratricopeptide (TPR) repeat protein
VNQYTRAISLDPRKTIFFSNRAVSLNALGEFERAEADCKVILSRDAKNVKAYYQRAVARMNLHKWREAQSDVQEVLKQQPEHSKARSMMEEIKKEVAKLPKQSREEVLNF